MLSHEQVNKGQRLRFCGRWVNHKTYGQQLCADKYGAPTYAPLGFAMQTVSLWAACLQESIQTHASIVPC